MNATVSWHEEPKFRGTFSILTSCLSTLFISTWSALHLDIPDSEQSGFMRFLDKIGWLFIGLLAPEYLLLLAFNQYLAARALTKFAQKKLESRPSGSAPWFVRCRSFLYSLFRGHSIRRKVSTHGAVQSFHGLIMKSRRMLNTGGTRSTQRTQRV